MAPGESSLIRGLAVAIGLWVALSGGAVAQTDLPSQVRRLPWQVAPATMAIGTYAVLYPGKSLQFLSPEATSRLLVLNENPPTTEFQAVAPTDLRWWSVFKYVDTGHILDNESIDPSSLLTTLKQNTENGAEERRKEGLPPLILQGWSVAPHYDVTTHNLEWGTRLTSDGQETINYTVRMLGRTGLISAILVSSPDTFDTDIVSFRTALRQIRFVSGQSYGDYRQGDHLAAYGLGALVLGGAAAAATSAGLLKGFGKLIAVAVFGGIAAIAGFFKRVFGKKA